MNHRKQASVRGSALAAIVVVLICGTSVLSASASTPRRKHLSLTTVNWVGPAAQSFTPELVAEQKGFFKQQGITSFSNIINSGSVPSWVAVLLSGSANFMQGSASVILSVAAGAPIRAIAMDTSPTDNELNITSSFAAAHNIPLVANTSAQAVAQFKALKGTHVSIAISNTSSDSYNWTVALAGDYGLTVGAGCATCDIDLTAVGSSTAAVAAVESGKTDGQASTPPYSVVTSPPTFDIPLSKIPPATKAAGQYVMTQLTTLQQHADTVQAVVNALTEATVYVRQHPAGAQALVSNAYASQMGYTTPETQDVMFGAYNMFTWLSYPSKAAYNVEVDLVNGAQPPASQIHLAWSAFAITKYAIVALKTFGLKVPAS